MGCHFLPQGIFLTQGSNPGLQHCGQALYRLSHQGIVYNTYCSMGEGRTIRVWFFCSAFQDPPGFYLLFRPWVTTFLPLFLGPILWTLDTQFISTYLPISLLRHLGTQSQRKRGHDRSGFFRLYRGVVELWVPFACSLSGCIYRER